MKRMLDLLRSVTVYKGLQIGSNMPSSLGLVFVIVVSVIVVFVIVVFVIVVFFLLLLFLLLLLLLLLLLFCYCCGCCCVVNFIPISIVYALFLHLRKAHITLLIRLITTVRLGPRG